MKISKAFSASLIALFSIFSITSCGENNKDNSYTNADVTDEIRSKIKENVMSTDLLPNEELENKTVKWLATWDINPDKTGKTKPTELVAFEEKYGGKIEWIRCDFGDRYEKLAQMIDSGEGVDLFYGGDMDAFPKCAIKGMFVPADDYIDFSSPLWEDVQEANDRLLWNNNHYCTIVQTTGDKVACIYNRKTIQEAGLDDPADLYRNGEWTWDTFHQMLQSFVDKDNDKFGIDGWWFEFGLIGTTGVPAVTLDNGKLVSNLSNPAMERVQNYMYELYTTGDIAIGVGDYGWNEHPEFIGEGKLLFYPVGLYEMYTDEATWKKTYGEDAFFVPMPKDPNADEYYIPMGMESYCFVKGGKNPKGAAKFLDCKRFAILDDSTKKIADQQFKNDFGWTDEMVEMQHSMNELANDNPTFDLSTGVSTDCGELLDTSLRNTARGTPWNETYDSIKDVVDVMIEEANEDSKEK